MNEPIVYIVPIIDTEGPTTGRSDLFDNWNSLGAAIENLTVGLRKKFRDSFGGYLKYSWGILDWAGFSSDDPGFKRRGHAGGLHAVWNFYRANILTDSRLRESGDEIYWHYHHPPKNGAWGWNDDWNDSRWHEYVIAKRMLDFGFFPAVYRAGKYVENDESSRWLERWIPFDFSNIAPAKREFCDWSRAPANWQPYHPSIGDYQHPGTMKRLIARSLPVAAKGGSGSLQEEDVEGAFREAKETGLSLFSFHSHDYYKSISDEFAMVCGMVEKRSRMSGIRYKFSNALDAIRSYIEPIPKDLSLRVERDGCNVSVWANHDIFGDMPFVAVEYKDGNVRREDVEKKGSGWLFTIPEGACRTAVGAADAYGNTGVTVLRV
ncbi:MAG: hypothetical protein HYW90_00325 [Candidatus Sungbacteria bacterium]|nr:hypothetical protein [Candidatus Sungbacteria bacterium]